MIIDIEYELYKMTIGLNKLWLLYTLNFIMIKIHKKVWSITQ